MNSRLFGRFLFLLIFLLAASPATAEERLPSGMQALLTAYPDHLCGGRPDVVVWCKGTTMPWDDGREKDFATLLDDADLQDQFRIPYPAGHNFPVPPPREFDPGRFRYEPFFRRMYGADRQEVEKNLVSVAWPFGPPGALQVTRVNGVNRRLEAVIRDLQKLPAPVRQVLREEVGGYNWRPIAGTGRLSLHSFGIAIDIGGPSSDYWLWDAGKNGGRFAWRNRIPLEIVEVFERHGFIWGGKWYHYDTMHFEYRPELLIGLQKQNTWPTNMLGHR